MPTEECDSTRVRVSKDPVSQETKVLGAGPKKRPTSDECDEVHTGVKDVLPMGIIPGDEPAVTIKNRLHMDPHSDTGWRRSIS